MGFQYASYLHNKMQLLYWVISYSFRRYYYVMSSQSNTKANEDSEATKACLSAEVGARVFMASVSVGYTHCQASSDDVATTNTTSASASDTIVDSVGGVSDSALTFVGDGATTESRAAFWDGVRRNPGVIEKTVDSICSLIPHARVSRVDSLYANCETALADYLKVHGTESCEPCQNGGMEISLNQTCYCACPAGTAGERCEMLTGERTV